MATDIIAQMQQTHDLYVAARKQKEASTSSTSSASSASATADATQSAYTIEISITAKAAATQSASAQSSTTSSLADKYGSFYTNSPNGEKLAQLRAANEARMQQRLGSQG